MPAAASSAPYRIDRYSLPASLWWISPATLTPWWARQVTAITSASSTRPVSCRAAVRHPAISRANASMTNAV